MTIHDLAEYEILDEHRVEDVQSDGFILRHKKSGARIAILSNNDDNKVFYIGFTCSLGGDIRTLCKYTDVESVTKIPDYGFCSPFLNMGDNVTDISNLSFRGITEIGNLATIRFYRSI